MSIRVRATAAKLRELIHANVAQDAMDGGWADKLRIRFDLSKDHKKNRGVPPKSPVQDHEPCSSARSECMMCCYEPLVVRASGETYEPDTEINRVRLVAHRAHVEAFERENKGA
jgi:hypothetical protein